MKKNRLPRLVPAHRVMYKIAFVIGAGVILNTLYLLYAAHIAGVGKNPEELSLFYQVMLLAHLATGIMFSVIAIWFAALHFLKMYRRNKLAWMRTSGSITVLAILIITLSGFFILSEANSRSNKWIFVLHQFMAAVFVAGFVGHRMLSRSSPRIPRRWLFLTASGSAAILVFGLLINSQNASGDALTSPDGMSVVDPIAAAEAYFDGLDPLVPNTDNPFFPSMATTATGSYLPTRILTHDDIPDLELFENETRDKGFAPSHFLGAQSCERCHADIVEQWSKSAHRFSSFNNPFYRKSVELTREKIGFEASQWCGGCHDPAIMLAGNMVKEIDPLTPESQAGLTCLSCHAIDKVHGLVGNANYNIHDKTESPYIFDQAKSGVGQLVHDYLLKAKPTVHKQRMLKPVFQTSNFCLSCHKVNLDTPVNNYRWLRGQNEFDAWHNSGVALNQPQTWYEPPTARQCQDCHMPLEEVEKGDAAAKEGKVRSHRFLSVNTALPAIRGDQETIDRQEALLRDNMIRLEIFAVRRESGEIVMNAHENPLSVRPGEVLQIDVVVRNLGVGHTFPGGTNDSNEGWIDFGVKAGERDIFRNGWVGNDHHVDKSAHFYKSVLVDKHGVKVARRNVSDIHAPIYANVIAPSTSDIARYRFRVPHDLVDGEQLTIDVRLMWRKFTREFTEFVFEGKPVPNLPITEIERDTLAIQVDSFNSFQAAEALPADEKRWMRFNDYGVGSVLDEDTKSAVVAFRKVTELVPNKMDGWLNLARTYLVAGDLQQAEHNLRRASQVEPDQARLAFFWGVLLERSGRLEEAAQAFGRTLEKYPNSRDTWTRLGRVQYLLGDHLASIKSYLEVLRNDPELAQAHHQLSLSYAALAEQELDDNRKSQLEAMAGRFKKNFSKYKLDENSSSATRIYREKNKFDNDMSQRIVVHEEGEIHAR